MTTDRPMGIEVTQEQPWCVHCGCKEKDHASDGTCPFRPSYQRWTPEPSRSSIASLTDAPDAVREAAQAVIDESARMTMTMRRRKIFDALAAALTQSTCLGDVRMLAWKTIDSAPTDGQTILAICASAYTPTAFDTWWQDGWTHYSRPDGKWGGGVGKWFPTHWMPRGVYLAALTTPAAKDDAGRLREALQGASDTLTRHHQWHAAQTDPDPEHGFIPADEYADSSLYEQTVATLSALGSLLRSGPRDTAALSPQSDEGDERHG